jgi:hypothetical protein
LFLQRIKHDVADDGCLALFAMWQATKHNGWWRRNVVIVDEAIAPGPSTATRWLRSVWDDSLLVTRHWQMTRTFSHQILWLDVISAFSQKKSQASRQTKHQKK